MPAPAQAHHTMKKLWILPLFILVVSGSGYALISLQHSARHAHDAAQAATANTPGDSVGCVFKTVMEGMGPNVQRVETPAQVRAATERGLRWLVQAQQKDGGFGAGTHARQDIRDPHAVKSDPATTAMVCMALLRTGSTPDHGTYAPQLHKGTEYLLVAVERAPKNGINITDLKGTQIQTKLGENIDVTLTSQYFSNLLEKLAQEHLLRPRVTSALQECVARIEKGQHDDGSLRGDGWAGVLQSSFAANALESADAIGIAVDSVVLHNYKDYQIKNTDAASGDVKTERGAGVMLYSVSGSSRASAKEARRAKTMLDKAKADGQVEQDAPMTQENLVKSGMDVNDAQRSNTAYEVYNTAKERAQEDEVINGFGSNGGEEFLSYLQTGESLIINNDSTWSDWYGTTTGRLVGIQGNDGSWQGHHCITSPVFCTATALLILSVNNDIDQLVAQGASVRP